MRDQSYGTHMYRGFDIIRRPYETAAIFHRGRCIASGLPTIQDARKWIDKTLSVGKAKLTPPDSRMEDDNFDVDLQEYLNLIGGPSREPMTGNTGSHWYLLRVTEKYGKTRTNLALDKFFEANPNW